MQSQTQNVTMKKIIQKLVTEHLLTALIAKKKQLQTFASQAKRRDKLIK